MNLSQLLLNQHAIKLSAEIKLGSNGENAKSAPVKVVANSGEPIDYPGIGRIVWDFATMTNKPRIPLDFAHEDQAAIGYLNKFSTNDGPLVCSGAIVPFGTDKGAEVVAKMKEGVPYQASIESHGGTLEMVEAGFSVLVNGKQHEGPLFVVRGWELAAVAVCKFGQDSNTSTELLLAASKNREEKKVLNLPSQNIKGSPMQDIKTEESEKAVTVEAEAEASVQDAVPAAAEVVGQPSKKEAEAVDAVADKATEEAVDAKQEAVAADAATEQVDPRAEFKRFVATFGDKAAGYYAEGKSFEQATEEHMAFLVGQNVELTKKLAATANDRGAKQAIPFSDDEKPSTKKTSLKDVIRLKH